MGTDYLHLLDRRAAEIIIRADESDLIVLIDCRTVPNSQAVLKDYWDEALGRFVDFPPGTTTKQRLQGITRRSTLDEIKKDLVRSLCIGGWLNLDYWGCWAEVFSVKPIGAISWEEFEMITAKDPRATMLNSLSRPEDTFSPQPTWLQSCTRLMLIIQSWKEWMIRTSSNSGRGSIFAKRIPNFALSTR